VQRELVMNEQSKESLSALMDGEVDDLELARLLKEAQTDPALVSVWRRYHLASSLLRREAVMPASERLARRLRDVLADEPAFGESRPGWVKPVASFAVAAAVAFAVVLGYQLLSVSVEDVRPVQATIDDVVRPAPLARANTRTASLTETRRLDAYMLHHAQHRALNEPSAVIPIAKVASFDTQ
jgi:sigma-E factor negative regulatory protein RseA